MEPWIPVLYDSPGLNGGDWIALASGLGGAVLGSVVGGMISWRLQSQAFARQAQSEASAKTEADRASTVRIMLGASLVLNDAIGTRDAIYSSLQKANEVGLSSQPLWHRVVPILGKPFENPISLDDLAPLITAREYDVVSRVVEMHMQHRVISQSLQVYSEKRTALNAMMPSRMVDRGSGLLSWEGNDEDTARLAPFTTELESLATILKDRVENFVPFAKKLNDDIGHVGEQLYGKTFPRVKVSPT